ncbi:hypothetical protein ACGFR8_31580 [Streptomyces brevispora]|uniref:hypothetical protein n=1 Tax=Streptomyces brevispora TaxID=887462 RepID=UPI0037143147
MLPPNLTRHFWEARRAFLRNAGKEVEPWFQLTPANRAVAESEVELFRQAIRAAEEEQDLLATLDAPVPPAEPAEPAEDSAAASDDCDCPGCSSVAAFLALLGRKSDYRLATPSSPLKIVPFGLLPMFGPTRDPLSAQEMTRIEEAARAAVESWVARGKPVRAVPAQYPDTGMCAVPYPTAALNTLKRPTPNTLSEESLTDFWASFRPVTTEP